MNNYSWLEQKLHKFALSSQFMREVAFDSENLYMTSELETDDHIFIAGLARAGTTILLNALYKTNIFASLTYADMPFILAPNLWSKISSNKKEFELKERAHGDGLKISTQSPEAFEEVFWKTFAEDDDKLVEKFKIYIRNILHKYRKKRYLSKNNQNIRRIELIASIFTQSKILLPYRDPLQHANSLLTQHKKFIEDSKNDHFISKYMQLIEHTEFGPNYVPIYNENLIFGNYLDINHWIEQWYLTYRNAFQFLKDKHNVYFISYEKLCLNEDYWFQIQEIAKIQKPFTFEFKQSKKEITSKIDKKLKEKAVDLFLELNSLTFK